MSESKDKSDTLTAAEKSRIQRNREKALHLKQAKLHPYKKDSIDGQNSIVKIHGTKYIDSGGGFLMKEPITGDHPSATASKGATKNESIPIPVVYEECIDCGDKFADSFLINNFSYAVCDKCHDPDDRHSLITRTEAKDEYLLKDCDLDKREPPLKYISRKNPHNIRWGEMKLYLHLQVHDRAMEVWGSEDELMRQHENREEKRNLTKIRKYNKKMKQLRMEVRSSLYTKKTYEAHVHEFGPETYNEEEDSYTHSCLTCSYSETYEKM